MTLNELVKELRKEKIIQYAVVYKPVKENKVLYLVLKSESYEKSIACIDAINKIKEKVNEPFTYYLTELQEIGIIINNVIGYKSKFEILY